MHVGNWHVQVLESFFTCLMGLKLQIHVPKIKMFFQKKKKKKVPYRILFVLIIYFTQVSYDARCLHHNFRYILMQDRECNCMPVRNDKV